MSLQFPRIFTTKAGHAALWTLLTSCSGTYTNNGLPGYEKTPLPTVGRTAANSSTAASVSITPEASASVQGTAAVPLATIAAKTPAPTPTPVAVTTPITTPVPTPGCGPDEVRNDFVNQCEKLITFYPVQMNGRVDMGMSWDRAAIARAVGLAPEAVQPAWKALPWDGNCNDQCFAQGPYERVWYVHYNDGIPGHFYTANPQEAQALAPDGNVPGQPCIGCVVGIVDRGPFWRGFKQGTPGTVALSRYVELGTMHHWFQLGEAQYIAVAGKILLREGVLTWVFPP